MWVHRIVTFIINIVIELIMFNNYIQFHPSSGLDTLNINNFEILSQVAYKCNSIYALPPVKKEK